MARRDAVQKSEESVERMWRAYADEIGIPRGVSAESNDPVPSANHMPMPMQRPARRSVWAAVRITTAIAVIALSVVAVAMLWKRPSTSSETAERPPAIVPSRAETQERGAAEQATVAGAQGGEIAQSPRRGMLYRIGFAFDSDRVGDDSKAGLSKIVAAMKTNPTWRLSIEGHTDAYGSREHNQWLSERRAQAVEAYLLSSGIAAERLTLVAFSASRPVAPNDAAGRVLNRRVEIYQR